MLTLQRFNPTDSGVRPWLGPSSSRRGFSANAVQTPTLEAWTTSAVALEARCDAEEDGEQRRRQWMGDGEVCVRTRRAAATTASWTADDANARK
nr:unnamed protein product [Digitaria exilis]